MVDQKGTGDFKTIQEAIDAARAYPSKRITISIKNGTYYEKVKVGEHYDYINKVNVIEYKYNLVTNKVYSESINTVNGFTNIMLSFYKKVKRVWLGAAG